MREILITFSLSIILLSVSAYAQIIVADHNAVADFDNIPDYWIEQAKELTIHYAHTSHGGQINSGLQYLETYVNSTKYSFARRATTIEGLPPPESPPALREYDGNPPETYIAPNDYWDNASAPDALDRTRAVADTDNYNYSMWSWCGQQSSNTVSTVQRYLDNMRTLENEYPDMNFILMTGHTDGTQGNVACDENNLPSGCSRLRRNNEMVINFAVSNDMVVFDFADIESWDPDGNHYPDTTDACAWCSTWCTDHPEDCQNLPSCAHSHGFNCVLKGKAFWWLMARLAGWDGGAAPTPCSDKCLDNPCNQYDSCSPISGEECSGGQYCCTGACTTPPPPCSENCMDNPCDQYDNCTSISSEECSDNKYCCSGSCTVPPPTCSDGTLYDQCSSTQPLYCYNGNLSDDCHSCGCPAGYDCQHNGTCITERDVDFDDNGDVNLLDIQQLTLRLGIKNSDDGWNATIDLVQDGEIDIYDLVYIARRFT